MNESILWFVAFLQLVILFEITENYLFIITLIPVFIVMFWELISEMKAEKKKRRKK